MGQPIQGIDDDISYNDRKKILGDLKGYISRYDGLTTLQTGYQHMNKMKNKIKVGDVVDGQMSSFVFLCEKMGLELVLREKMPLFDSWVEDGFIVVERRYCPYARLYISLEDKLDFRLYTSVAYLRSRIVIKIFRDLYFHYFGQSLRNADNMRMVRKIKSSLQGKNECVISVFGREEELRANKNVVL